MSADGPGSEDAAGRWRSLRRAGARSRPALLGAASAGGLATLAAQRFLAPDATSLSLGFLAGAAWGVAVVVLFGLFRIARWGLPWAGLVCGPVPVALVVSETLTLRERAALYAGSALLGFLLGLLEWARRGAADGSGGPAAG